MNKIIKVQGARAHNLKNINLIIPRNKLVVISGVSGSGKSSLAFNTLYAEGQLRYVESLSSYTRQFLLLMEKPDIDHIEGLSPVVSVRHKSILRNSHSTIGTITEIHDYLRLLFSRAGEARCPNHNVPLKAKTISQMVDEILAQPKEKRLMLLAPVIKNHKKEYTKILENLSSQGYIRVRINGKVYSLSNLPNFNSNKKYAIEVVIDRFKVRNDIVQRLAESFETALKLSGGTVIISNVDDKVEEWFFSSNSSCPICGYSIHKLEPHLFSFGNPSGACPTCNGLGVQQYFDPDRVVQNPNLSLANSAIPDWDRHNFHRFQIIRSLAEHYRFDTEMPWNSLSKTVHQIILFGSEKENIKFKCFDHSCCDGSTIIHYHPFDGIIHNMERLYKETKSSKTRKKLSKFISNRSCSSCNGTRLRLEARHVFVQNTTLPIISNMSIVDAIDFFKNLKFSGQLEKITEKLLKEIKNRLKSLMDLGLNYLTLSHSAKTLSTGELQRVYLAKQIGSGLVDTIYVLDEPSIGLHQRDNKSLLNALVSLRNIGNTIIVVEHDQDTIRAADYIIDIGPGAGIHGGHIVAEGSLDSIMSIPESLTGQYMSGKCQITVPKKRTIANSEKVLKLIGACGNNLKDVTLVLPIGLFTCITGVSGSGKSTLVNDTLLLIAQCHLNRATTVEPAPYQDIQGMEYFDRIININQKPISYTSHSNLATYIGIFTFIRELFASVKEARSRGYTPQRFSFNRHGGRCESCQGEGIIKVRMHFLPDVRVLCDQCQGKRYNRETLEIKYKGKTIHEVLQMTVGEAREFFNVIFVLVHKLEALIDVGLTYLCLGQAIATLSSGEFQRMKLAKELFKYNTNRTLYILDEPTIGLHYSDIKKLLHILHQLRDYGNTIVVIEHNLDVIKTADWIVDLGPEGGSNGGEIIISGTPETVAKCKNSYTAQSLKLFLK